MHRVLLSASHVFLFILVCAFSATAQVPADPSYRPPEVISGPQPVYPAAAKAAGLGGRISVEITIDENGNVISTGGVAGPAELCRGGDTNALVVAMRQSVKDALTQAKFKPATRNGIPVKTTVWVGSTFDPFQDEKPVQAGDLPRAIQAGVINGKALKLPRPDYPPAARAVRASGAVTVAVLIDEQGRVVSAQAKSGHPLLRGSAVESACGAKFSPTSLDGKLVKVNGIITYNFVP